MAAFVGMCDGGSPEEGCEVASKDDTTINALQCVSKSSHSKWKILTPKMWFQTALNGYHYLKLIFIT